MEFYKGENCFDCLKVNFISVIRLNISLYVLENGVFFFTNSIL